MIGGKVIAVRSVSAGTGRSSIAANLAFELAAGGKRVCLIDLDDAWPSLHRYFGLPQQQAAVLAAMRLMEQEKLDANSLEKLSVRLVSKGVGVDFLSGYGLNLNRAAINLSTLSSLLAWLAVRFDALVIDTAGGFEGGLSDTVSAAASLQLLVVPADAINLGRFLDAQPALTGSFSLVVNRLRASVLGAQPEWQVRQLLQERTEFKSAVLIPEDAAFDEALRLAMPMREVAAKSKALGAIGELAQRLA